MKNRWKFLKVKLPKPKPILVIEYIAKPNQSDELYERHVNKIREVAKRDGIDSQYHIFFTFRRLTENSKADYAGWNIKMLSSHADDGELDLEKLIEKTKNITAE